MKNVTFLFLFLFLNSGAIKAQGEDSIHSKINIGFDLLNRYVWRGLDFGSAPSIQPYFEYAHKSGISIGCWSAFNTTGTYNEVDLYAKYAYKGFTITATDYFFPSSSAPIIKAHKYFNYKDSETGHGFEGTAQWKGGNKFPLSLTVATFIYGADKDLKGDQRYSTYTELGYTFECKSGKLDAFAGFTPQEGMYGNTMGFVNIGVTGYRDFIFTEKLSLPIKASIITNPQVQNIYFIIGITI